MRNTDNASAALNKRNSREPMILWGIALADAPRAMRLSSLLY